MASTPTPWSTSPSISGSHLLFGRRIPHGGQVIPVRYQHRYVAGHRHQDRYREAIQECLADPGERQLRGMAGVNCQAEDGRADQRATSSYMTSPQPRRQSFRRPTPSGNPLYGPRSIKTGPCTSVEAVSLVAKTRKSLAVNSMGTETVLYEFRPTRASSFTGAVDNPDSTTDVYFDRANCRER